MTEKFVFDIQPKSIEVEIEEQNYLLKEASGDAACKYQNAMIDCMDKLVDGKPSKIRNVGDVDPLLVSLCLFDEDGKIVPQMKIRSWPNRVVNQLVKWIKENSDLEIEKNKEEKEESEKND